MNRRVIMSRMSLIMIVHRLRWPSWIALPVSFIIAGSAPAGEASTDASQSAPAATTSSEPADDNGRETVPRERIPLKTKAVSASPEADLPGYARPVSAFGFPGTENLDWLDFGIEQRTRYERRVDDYRRNQDTDDYFLMRSRGYLGVRDIIDPLRFGLEFQDARQFSSAPTTGTGDVDEADFLQAFGELYFKDALGPGQPFSFRAGRMSDDYIDRRLIARNRWRNTTNAFDGFRLRAGDENSDWQVTILAMQPVERRTIQRDRTDEERWFYGLIGTWRGWDNIVIEPYYLILDSDYKDPSTADREIHTLGTHLFGPIPGTRFDYDLDFAGQFGDVGGQAHRAIALHAELGYTFDHAWKPRLAAFINYASGDKDPNDGEDGRFDSLFGASHSFYGYSDLFTWQNTINPSLHLKMSPMDKLSMEAFYRMYYLASRKDAFIRADLRDTTGEAGRFVGQEIDMRVSYQLSEQLSLEIGYAHFMPGTFVEKTGNPDDSDLFYVQTVLRF